MQSRFLESLNDYKNLNNINQVNLIDDTSSDDDFLTDTETYEDHVERKALEQEIILEDQEEQKQEEKEREEKEREEKMQDLQVTQVTQEIKITQDLQVTPETTTIATKRKQYERPGISGLRNIGNTCYMNSVIQSLFSVRYFNSYFRKVKYFDNLVVNVTQKYTQQQKKILNLEQDANIHITQDILEKLTKHTVTVQLSNLFKVMYYENCTAVPASFKNIVSHYNKDFAGFNQHDAHELINFVLDRIHEELKSDVRISFNNVPTEALDFEKFAQRYSDLDKEENKENKVNKDIKLNSTFLEYKRENKLGYIIYSAFNYWKLYLKNNFSVVTDQFTGIFYSEIICTRCNNVSPKFDPFTTLSVEINNNTTLDECLANFSTIETLNEKNQYFCEVCNIKVDALKKLYVWEPPEVLIVHLKRFKKEFVNNHYSVSKISNKITYPIVNLRLDSTFNELHKQNVTYNLSSVVLHRGGCGGGHYLAYSKNSLNNLWYEFNDDTVLHVPDSNIENEIITEDAYMMIYEKN